MVCTTIRLASISPRWGLWLKGCFGLTVEWEVSGEGVVMTTLDVVTPRKRPAPSAEELAAKELVRLAREQGWSLTGPDGLLKQFTKERAGDGAERGDDRAPRP
jgi:hypothetical protein